MMDKPLPCGFYRCQYGDPGLPGRFREVWWCMDCREDFVLHHEAAEHEQCPVCGSVGIVRVLPPADNPNLTSCSPETTIPQ